MCYAYVAGECVPTIERVRHREGGWGTNNEKERQQ